MIYLSIIPISRLYRHMGRMMTAYEYNKTERCEASFCYRGNAEGVFEVTLTGWIRNRKDMKNKALVMCASNYYTQKYYLDCAFDKLPQEVKDELKIMCVLYTEEVGGIFTMMFDEDGELQLISTCDEGDLLYDDIGSELLIRKMRQLKQDLFESLEKYYRAFILKEDIMNTQ